MPIDFKLVALIEAMNDRPIAFNRHYVSLGCGINGSLMLSQMVYWSKRTKDQNGYFYKTQEEWLEETGLTRYEQEGARKRLKELGFISEHKHGVPCKVHFKVNHECLYSALIQYVENQQTGMWKNHKLDSGKTTNKDAENQQTNTESTTDITTESTTDIINKGKSKFNPKHVELPVNVDKDIWFAFVDMRNVIKKPMSERAVKIILNKLSGFGFNANACLDQSIVNNWQDVYDLKVQRQQYQTAAQRTALEHDKWRMAEQQTFGEKDVTPVNQFFIGE